MIQKAIRFFCVNRDGSEKVEHGTAWLTTDGALDFANDSVREIMTPMIRRVGEQKAFEFFTQWSNGYTCSEPVELTSAAQ